MSATSLDLHGRNFEDAISEVTLFLERIRRTVASSSRGRGRQNILFVTIITGSGSHSTHGPVLRSGVQRLLEKRGMNWTLERGGGAFKVDALSGHDLYDEGAPTCSKVVVAEQNDFHQQMAASRRQINGGSYAASAAANPAPPIRTVSVPTTSAHSYTTSISAQPLPRHVASDDAAIRAATQMSVTDAQQHRNQHDQISKEYEREYQKAVSESKLDNTSKEKQEDYEEELLQLAYKQSLGHLNEGESDDEESSSASDISEEEDYEEEQLKIAYEKSLEVEAEQKEIDEKELKLAYELSLSEEQQRKQLEEKQYEDALILAMEQSAQEVNDKKPSEEDLIERALSESKALAEAEKARNSEDDLLKKALEESLLLEENRKSYHEQEVLATSHGVDLLDVVKQLSLKQEEEDALAEEEAIKRAIELSMTSR